MHSRTKARRLQIEHQPRRSKALGLEIVILPTRPPGGPKKYVRELSRKGKKKKMK